MNEFLAAFDARYANRMTEAQRKALLMWLAQAGFAPFAVIESLAERAHTKMEIDIRREDDGGGGGNSFATDRDRGDLDVRCSYRVEPDGTNCRVGDLAYEVRLG